MAVTESDLGSAFGVISVRNEGWWPSDMYTATEGRLSLYEAYVAVGDDMRLTFGRAPSLIKTISDRPLDWLGGDYGYGVFFPLTGTERLPLTADAIQAFFNLSEELQVGVALEGGHIGYVWRPEIKEPRLLGTIRYDDGQTEANVLVARFGDVSDYNGLWSARFSFESLVTDSFRILGAGSFGDDQVTDLLVSARAKVGIIELAGTVHKVGGYTSYWTNQPTILSGSATAELTPEIAARIGILATQAEHEQQTQVGAGLLVNVAESAGIELEFGHAGDEWYSLGYARVAVDWHINQSIRAKAAAVVTTEGAYKIESEVVTSFR
jgi:hypothetical protein